MQVRSIRKAALQTLRTSEDRPIYLSFLFAVCYIAPLLVYHVADLLISAAVDTSPVGIAGFGQFSFYTAYLSVSWLLWLILAFCVSLWQLFYQNFTLNLSRGKRVSFRDFTAPVRIAGKVFWLHVLIAIYTSLWSMLFMFPITMAVTYISPDLAIQITTDPDLTIIYGFILLIPGYLMAYRYRLACLILFDHEEWTASQAIHVSKQLTRGYKMRFFKLDICYCWYHILMTLPAMVLPYVFAALYGETTLTAAILSAVVPLLVEFVMLVLFLPRVKLADAILYRYILDHPPIVPPVPNTGFPVFPGPQNPPPEWISGPSSQPDPQDPAEVTPHE